MGDILFRQVEIFGALPFVLLFALSIGWRLARRERAAYQDFRLSRAVGAKYRIGLPAFAICLITALADPVEIQSDILNENLQGKLLFLVDNSASSQSGRVSAQNNDLQDLSPRAWNELLARRYKNPTRLALCLETMIETLRDVRGLEVAVMPYSGSAQIRTNWMALGGPAGRAQLEGLFRSIQPQVLGSGTDLVSVFYDARDFFGTQPDIALLCSDSGGGGDTEKLRDEIAKFSAGKKHIPIYVLGVGGALGPRGVRGEGVRKAPIPQYDAAGSLLGFARYEDKPIEPEFVERVLREDIAEASGGAYQEVRALDDGRALLRRAVLASIRAHGIRIPNAHSRAAPFVAASLVLLLWIFDGFQWVRWIFVRKKIVP